MYRTGHGWVHGYHRHTHVTSSYGDLVVGDSPALSPSDISVLFDLSSLDHSVTHPMFHRILVISTETDACHWVVL